MSNNHLSNVISGDLTDAQIEALSKYHWDQFKQPRYDAVRIATENMLKVIRDNCPRCAGRTRALQTCLELRMMANATIALEGVEVDES
jgi:hypothetical protein